MENNILYITILISVFITVILAFFFVSIVLYHRRYVKLQKQHINAEINIQENERKRIANDLHDSIGPMLSAVKMNINCIDTITTQDEEVIQKSGVYIDDIITNLRRISYNLLPNTLERKGVIEALTEYVENLKGKHTMNIALNVVSGINIPLEKGVHIYRILQEIIHNTLKHAKAALLKIDLEEKNGVLQILTTDNGVGFNKETTKTDSSGLGLKSINSRIELLNGKLTIESVLNEGTIYILKIPL